MKVKKDYSLKGGLLVSNPIPEDQSLPKEMMDEVILNALNQAKKDGIHGKEATPYLLKKVVELTGGESLRANIDLIIKLNYNNFEVFVWKELFYVSNVKFRTCYKIK